MACHPTDRSLRVLAVTKSNVAGPVPSLGYRIRDGAGAPVIEWVGPTEVDANALGESPTELKPRDRATEWLRAELAGGPRKATDLYAAAAANRIPERTLRRAKAGLGAQSRQVRCGGGKEWYWHDPAAAWPADAPVEKPFELPPLGEL